MQHATARSVRQADALMAMRRRLADIGPQPLVGTVTVALALALLAAAWAGTTGLAPGLPDMVLSVTLVGVIVASYQFPLHLYRHTKVYMASVPYYLLAVLAPPALAATAAALGALAGELSVRRRRGNDGGAVASEVGRRAMVLLLAALVAHHPGTLTMHPLALMGAAVALGAGDIFTAPLVLAPMSRTRPLPTVVTVAREAFLIEAAQYLVALLGALAAERQVWAVLFLAFPTALVYVAFRNVMLARAAQQVAETARAQAVAAQHAAEEATRVRDDFLTGATHELRTPLTNILGRCDLLRLRLDQVEGPTGDWLQTQLASLRTSAERLAATMETMTDMAEARVEQSVSVPGDQIDIGTLAHAVTESRAGRTPLVHLHAESGLFVQGDRSGLARVLHTILAHACASSPATTPVHVTVRAQGHWAVLTVRDQGDGIPTEDLPHVFTPFRGVAAELGATGDGLSLAGAKAVVEQHGGSVRIESAPGAGTAVEIRLPCTLLNGQECDQAAVLTSVEKRGASAQGELDPYPWPGVALGAKDGVRSA